MRKIVLLKRVIFTIVLAIVSSLLMSSGSVSVQADHDNGNILIVLDPGHGGPGNSGDVKKDEQELGAHYFGHYEKNINLQYAKELCDRLQKEGYEVIMTRTNDRAMSLGDRRKIAEDKHANIFVSIHHNAALDKNKQPMEDVKGSEVFVYKKDPEDPKSVPDEKSNRLANAIHKEFTRTGIESRGVKYQNLGVLRGNTMPSVLVEVEFICNETGMKRALDPVERSKSVNACAKGIISYINASRKGSK